MHKHTLPITVAAVLTAIFFGITAATAQPSAPPAPRQQASDGTRTELKRFDRYLDQHPHVAKQLRADPALATNPQFLAKHTGLQKFLVAHPGVQKQLQENPGAVMQREHRHEKHARKQSSRDNQYTQPAKS